MSLSTIFGINGVGKDTVATLLRRSVGKKMSVVSMSRLLMYSLGITDSYDVIEPVTTEQYQELEFTSQSRIAKVESTTYRDLLTKFSDDDSRTVVCLAHLVTALHLGHDTRYLTEKPTPDWYITLNDYLIQLVASPEEILERRKLEIASRNRPLSLDQIKYHQYLCDGEWNRIASLRTRPRRGSIVIVNTELSAAVDTIRRLIC